MIVRISEATVFHTYTCKVKIQKSVFEKNVSRTCWLQAENVLECRVSCIYFCFKTAHDCTYVEKKISFHFQISIRFIPNLCYGS